MKTHKREQLMDLHRAAINAWEAAVIGNGTWDAAYKADDAFRDAVIHGKMPATT